MLLAMGFGAASFGKRFRFYSIATILVLLGFGLLTGLDAPRVQVNFPTPLLGVWESILIGAYLVWVMVLAVILLQAEKRSGSLYLGIPVKLKDNGRGKEQQPEME